MGAAPQRAALACAAAVVLPAAAAGCSVDPGTVVTAAPSVTVTGEESSIRLPHGRLDFVVDPDAEVGESDVADDDDPTDADQFVGVSWDFTPGGDSSGAAYLAAEGVPATVALVAGGERYSLGTAYSVPGGKTAEEPVFVAVEGGTAVDDLALEVTMDGVTQRVSADGSEREAGRAAALYDLPKPVTLPCAPRFTPGEVRAQAACTVSAQELPWVSELGWAKAGHSWYVVSTSTRVQGLSVDAGRYVAVELTDASTLAGTRAAKVLQSASRPHSLGTSLDVIAAYDAPADDALTFALRQSVVAQHRDGPEPLRGRTVELRDDVTLRD